MTARGKLSCFKAYDVRGKIGHELNEDIAYRIGCATAQSLKAKTLALGYDARETSPVLAQAVARGASDAGADILSLGLAGTEEIYAAVSAYNADAGIEVTASHNPIDYNGMKIVKRGAQPLTELEFLEIKHLAEVNSFVAPANFGLVKGKHVEARNHYIEKIMSFVDLSTLKPLKIVINSGNGAAGPTIEALSRGLKKRGVQANFVYLNHEPDPSFPNGIPNPLLVENQISTSHAVIREKADFGVAFDGDFDRCFFFDHLGEFVPSEYIVGILANAFLLKKPGSSIVHDPRIIWNTIDIVKNGGGRAITSRTGHAFIKQKMREARAIYGGEMSGHHYFRDFSYCDSGMIPWLLIWELLSQECKNLSDLILVRRRQFPSSGEINFQISEPSKCLNKVRRKFELSAVSVDEQDGLSMSFEKWRFNLRKSNTEALVRLNLEALGDVQFLKDKIEELTLLIKDL